MTAFSDRHLFLFSQSPKSPDFGAKSGDFAVQVNTSIFKQINLRFTQPRQTHRAATSAAYAPTVDTSAFLPPVASVKSGSPQHPVHYPGVCPERFDGRGL
jgi:hypothetical protein